MKGIAFEFGDTTYTCANRTMVTSTKGTIKQGYWLDVLNGPFVSHGVEIEDSQEHAFARGLFKVVNKGTGAEQQRHHTVEVAMYNIINFMWELEVCFENKSPFLST
jgi:dynein assembly factor 3